MSLSPGFMGAIHAIEYTTRANFRRLWLECDSTLVYKAFFHQEVVPWSIRGHWRKCLKFCRDINFKVSHIFQGNHCAISWQV